MHKKIQAILILLVALLIVSAAIYTNAQTPRVSDEMLGGDKRDRDATASDPFVDPCAYFTKADNERCTILDLLMLHGAEMTYASTHGNGNYGLFFQLINSGLMPPTFGNGGPSHGYVFVVGWVAGSQTVPATFRLWAVPVVYGRTGVRSFLWTRAGYCAELTNTVYLLTKTIR